MQHNVTCTLIQHLVGQQSVIVKHSSTVGQQGGKAEQADMRAYDHSKFNHYNILHSMQHTRTCRWSGALQKNSGVSSTLLSRLTALRCNALRHQLSQQIAAKHYNTCTACSAAHSHLQVVWCAPEELRSVQHTTEQVDSAALQEDLPNALSHLLTAHTDLAVGG
jgi:hypothetical protein